MSKKKNAPDATEGPLMREVHAVVIAHQKWFVDFAPVERTEVDFRARTVRVPASLRGPDRTAEVAAAVAATANERYFTVLLARVQALPRRQYERFIAKVAAEEQRRARVGPEV